MFESYIVIFVSLFLFYILILRLVKIEKKIILIYKILSKNKITEDSKVHLSTKNIQGVVNNYDIYDIPIFLRNVDYSHKEPIEETDNHNISEILIDVNYSKEKLIEETEMSDNIINFENYKNKKKNNNNKL
jgi:hypothetical protein